MEWWIILLIVVGAVICLMFALAAFTFKVAFARMDKNPCLKYFSADDFGLTAKKVSAKDGELTLNGYIYRNERIPARKELVIFQHGMGPGQAAYTTEIAYFCGLGYTVLALDIRGCELSEGRGAKGIYSGVNCVKAAIDFAKCDEQLKNKKIYLVGHSWGGYSVLCASAERKVDKVVAISAPFTPVSTLYNGAAKIIGAPLAFLMRPFWYIINFFKFGAKGNANPAKCIQKSGTPAMLVHGDNDNIVAIKRSAYAKAKGENVKKYLAQNKSHNPYNTIEAQKLLIELNEKLSTFNKNKDYFSSFDFNAATQEDEKVMCDIADFLED